MACQGVPAPRWDQAFTREPCFNYGTDSPYVELWKEYSSAQPVIRSFMQDSEDSERFRSQLQRIEEFCAGLGLQSLNRLDGFGCENETPCALLDDRSNDGGPSCSRTYLGPLTALGLYGQLKRKVSSIRPY